MMPLGYRPQSHTPDARDIQVHVSVSAVNLSVVGQNGIQFGANEIEPGILPNAPVLLSTHHHLKLRSKHTETAVRNSKLAHFND